MAVANGSAPDEAVEEQRGVADDARRPRLFVLTALQGQPVVHVTFSVEARLEGAGPKWRENTVFNVRANCGRKPCFPVLNKLHPTSQKIGHKL